MTMATTARANDTAYAAVWSKFWKRSSTNSVSGLGLADQSARDHRDGAVLAERPGQGQHDAVGERPPDRRQA